MRNQKQYDHSYSQPNVRPAVKYLCSFYLFYVMLNLFSCLYKMCLCKQVEFVKQRHTRVCFVVLFYAMVTIHIRATYRVSFTKHRTSLRRSAGGRKNRTTLVIFLDIVRCQVKFRYYLKFHGTHTAFCRV